MTKINEIVPWKNYLIATAEIILIFCLATFSLGMYLIHGGMQPLYSFIAMVLLYVTILGLCIQRLATTFSIAALMLIIPIAPLIILLLMISLIPILQWLRYA